MRLTSGQLPRGNSRVTGRGDGAAITLPRGSTTGPPTRLPGTPFAILRTDTAPTAVPCDHHREHELAMSHELEPTLDALPFIGAQRAAPGREARS